ncbi:hypothetical protein Pmani_022187 [Petrolisthes manimaculis]|uniref:Uncharacterized protein n=1 Tax=Petrolisthes manimaculis TaxID=1843537 RepID=A0AAE1PEC2_9EUCA|nr:hypothetical protein Pmani_022187 [Petrolisthes manimaculis]
MQTTDGGILTQPRDSPPQRLGEVDKRSPECQKKRLALVIDDRSHVCPNDDLVDAVVVISGCGGDGNDGGGGGGRDVVVVMPATPGNDPRGSSTPALLHGHDPPPTSPLCPRTPRPIVPLTRGRSFFTPRKTKHYKPYAPFTLSLIFPAGPRARFAAPGVLGTRMTLSVSFGPRISDV